MRPELTSEALRQAGVGAFFRPRDLMPLGLTHYHLQRLVAEGHVERVGRGLYRLADAEATEVETTVMVASAVPHAIVCLLSALRVHEIGTQSPHQVWLAIDRKARKPARLPAKVRIVRFSGQMLSYGVVTQSMQGVDVRLTNPARTVVDCFRYRNKVGLDVAMEALRDAVRRRKATVSEIDRAAEVCRIRTVIGPYLEALLA
ncbi:MAG: transcriptional regulator [Alphaproteobacteria bacterium]|nr:MAG: transcriptional regulator [Alphaproteobacteria bacterium]